MDIFIVLDFIISLAVILSNSIVIIVIGKSSQLHLPTLWNIVVMAACDWLNGLYFLVFLLPSKMLGHFAYPNYMMRPASVLITIIFGQNNLNVLLSLVDRYISVCWPLHYPRLMSKKRFVLAMLSMHFITLIRLALIASSTQTVEYIVPIGVCLVDYDTIRSRFASVGVTFLTSIIIVILLVMITLELKRSERKVFSTSTKGKKIAFTYTMCISAVVFILCYLPMCVAFIWSFINGKVNTPHLIVKISLTSFLSNSFWNVIIYASTYKPFKDAFLQLFCPKLFRERARHDARAVYRQTKIFAITKELNSVMQ